VTAVPDTPTGELDLHLALSQTERAPDTTGVVPVAERQVGEWEVPRAPAETLEELHVLFAKITKRESFKTRLVNTIVNIRTSSSVLSIIMQHFELYGTLTTYIITIFNLPKLHIIHGSFYLQIEHLAIRGAGESTAASLRRMMSSLAVAAVWSLFSLRGSKHGKLPFDATPLMDVIDRKYIYLSMLVSYRHITHSKQHLVYKHIVIRPFNVFTGAVTMVDPKCSTLTFITALGFFLKNKPHCKGGPRHRVRANM